MTEWAYNTITHGSCAGFKDSYMEVMPSGVCWCIYRTKRDPEKWKVACESYRNIRRWINEPVFAEFDDLEEAKRYAEVLARMEGASET